MQDLLFTIQELAEITNGVWENLTADLKINEIHYIPKYINKGDLFVVRHYGWPKGKNNLPNQYAIPNAINNGAVAIMLDNKSNCPLNIPILRVKNTYLSIKEIANQASLRSTAKRIIVVGSYGKTGFKTHASQLFKLQYNTYIRFNSANYAPSTYCGLASLKKDTEIFITEQPVTREKKMIRRTNIVAPTICVLTSIGHEHIERFKTIDEIIRLKLSVASALPPGGKFIIPYDSEHYSKVHKALQHYPTIDILTFGSANTCNARILDKRFNQFGWDIIAAIEDRIVTYRVPFPEYHAPIASLAELLCVYHAGVDIFMAANNYYKCRNFKSSGNLYQVNFNNKHFYLYDQSNRGGIEGYISFFKCLSYLKPKHGGKKILVTSSFVDHKDGEIDLINTDIFKKLIQEANINTLFSVEYFSEHINVLADKSIWKNHSFHFDKIKDDIISSIENNDILCIKGIFESSLYKFIEYLKKLPNIHFSDITNTPLKNPKKNLLLKNMILVKNYNISYYHSLLDNYAMVSWLKFVQDTLEESSVLLLNKYKESWCIFKLTKLNKEKRPILKLCGPPLPFDGSVLEQISQDISAFNNDQDNI